MRILGVDYGKKRVGVALSDESGKFAWRKAGLSAGQDLTAALWAFALSAGVKTIIIGESRDYGGRENPLIVDIHILERQLKDKNFEVILEPEYSSSVEAMRFQGKNEMHDASAAAIILQRYLDKNRI